MGKYGVLRRYKLHLHFVIVLWRINVLEFLKKCILDVSWKLVGLDL